MGRLLSAVKRRLLPYNYNLRMWLAPARRRRHYSARRGAVVTVEEAMREAAESMDEPVDDRYSTPWTEPGERRAVRALGERELVDPAC